VKAKMSLENISTKNIRHGIKKSFDNASALLCEADILKRNKKYARGYTLCQIAIEELAKIPMLFGLWINRINGNKINYKRLNENFKDHPQKTKLSAQWEIIFLKTFKEQTGSTWPEEVIKKNEKIIAKIEELNVTKNESLYVSVVNNDFQLPEELIHEETFNNLYATALLRKNLFKSIMDVSEKYIVEIAHHLEDEKIIDNKLLEE
jgi:AbiV family abortive infection protein